MEEQGHVSLMPPEQQAKGEGTNALAGRDLGRDLPHMRGGRHEQCGCDFLLLVLLIGCLYTWFLYSLTPTTRVHSMPNSDLCGIVAGSTLLSCLHKMFLEKFVIFEGINNERGFIVCV
jgi:hypothetical protein